MMMIRSNWRLFCVLLMLAGLFQFQLGNALAQDDGGDFQGGGGMGRRARFMQGMQGGDNPDFGGGFGGRRGGFGRGGGGGFGRGGWGGGGGFPGGGFPGGGGYGDADPGDAGGQFNRGAPANSSTTTSKPASSPSLVPGFGESVSLPPVPGFGGPLTSSSISTSADSSGSASSSTSTGSAANSQAEDGKIRAYAASKMKQYDKNSNGILEREEWTQMGGEPEKYDLNKDGKITMDELVSGLKGWNPSSDESGDAGGKDRSRGAVAGPAGKTGGRTAASGRRHYLTSAELLPEGLSDRFFRLDTNGDGQIEMAEFATSWTDALAREFSNYDRNGDGVITPDEWLKTEPPKK